MHHQGREESCRKHYLYGIPGLGVCLHVIPVYISIKSLSQRSVHSDF